MTSPLVYILIAAVISLIALEFICWYVSGSVPSIEKACFVTFLNFVYNYVWMGMLGGPYIENYFMSSREGLSEVTVPGFETLLPYVLLFLFTGILLQAGLYTRIIKPSWQGDARRKEVIGFSLASGILLPIFFVLGIIPLFWPWFHYK